MEHRRRRSGAKRRNERSEVRNSRPAATRSGGAGNAQRININLRMRMSLIVGFDKFFGGDMGIALGGAD